MDDSGTPENAPARLPREYFGSLVAIRPGRKLVFNVDSPIKRMSRNITIRNISNFPVTYKIKTTSREGYRVKPHTGLLESGQSADSVITLLPHNQYRVPQDKFLVMVARADSKFKARDKRKLENFWKKFSKDKIGADYMEHQLSCALNVDEYLANEEDDEVATDLEVDQRFYDETAMGDDYITPASSVLIRQNPVQRKSSQMTEQVEQSSADFIKPVSPPPTSSMAQEFIEQPPETANAKQSVLSEDNEYLVAESTQPVVRDEWSYTEGSPLDQTGRPQRKVRRTFKSIVRESKTTSTEQSDKTNRTSKKVQIVEPDMFKKDKNFNSDKDSQNITPDEVVISLMRTEDVLKKHITCFKGFQVFVVVAICALCIIIIILMVNFPSAISVQKSGS